MSFVGIFDPAGDHTPEKSRLSAVAGEVPSCDWPETGLAARIRKPQVKLNETVRKYQRNIVLISS